MNVQPSHQSIADAEWRILLIDSDEDDFILIRDMLKEVKGRRINLASWASTYEMGQTKLAEEYYDAVLVDNNLGPRTGIDLVRATNERGFAAPLILFTGRGSYEEDIEAMRAGATLYMSKNDLNALSLERFIRYAIERKQTETSLKESEEKYRTFFENLRESVVFFEAMRDEQGNLIDLVARDANPPALAATGLPREEMLGRRAGELFPIEALERALIHLPRMFETGEPWTDEQVYKDRYFRYTVFRMTNNMIAVSTEDITERNRAEKALRESEAKYRALFENSTEAIFLTRPDGSIQAANPAASKIFGWSEEELIRLDRSGIQDTEDPWLTEALEIRKQMGRVQAQEFTGIRKGGERFPIEVDSVVLEGEPKRSFVIVRDITERKRAEDALRESQERFRVLFHNRHSPMLLIDPETGQIIDANPAASDYYGWSQEEMTRMKITDINTLPVDQIHQVIHDVEATATGKRFTFRHRLANGEVRDVEVSTGPIHIGQKEYLFSIINDVTERKKIQEALRKSEEKFAKAFRSSPIALAISTIEDGRFIEINDSYADLYGYSREEIIGHTSLELNILLPEDREKIIEKFRQGRGFRDVELHGRAKSGEIRDTLFSTEPIEIDGKEYILSVINNITERKQAEQALRDSEERERHRAHELAAILDAVPAYIFITHDPDSRTMTANRATQELLRSEPGDNISKSAPEPEIPRQFRAMRNGKEIPNEELPVQLAAAKCIHVEDYEFDIVFEDGSSRRLMGNAAPLCDEHGNPAGAVGAFIDITELRRIEQETSERIAQVEVQHRLLEHREMERSQLARDLHDGPIQSLGGLGFSLQMLQSSVANQGASQMIEQVKQDVRDLVGELRGVCNELRPPMLERFGFRKAVQAHLDGFREKHLDIKLDLDMTENPEKLPENMATALFRIYQEALNNIVRHSEATEVSIHFAFDPQKIQLDIQDNGKGLPVKIDWVELTRQGHFGLVGMKERAEAIGGEFKAQSSPGKGTTIRVTVPIAN